MIRSLFRFALAPLAVGALGAMMLVAGPAQSGSVTINDNGACASWSWSGSTLTCTPASPTALSCNPTASPAVQLTGSASTIAANCAGASQTATYTWTPAGGNDAGCPAMSNAASGSITASSATPLGCTYALAATDGAKSGSGSVTVKWADTLPFTCDFNPAPGPATVGAALPLTVKCSNPITISAVTWSATLGSGATFSAGASTAVGTNSVTFSTAGSWTITANVTNGPGTDTAVANSVVSVSAVANTNLCAAQGFAKTVYYKWDWAATPPSHLDTQSMTDMASSSSKGLGTNGILVVEFTPTAPANPGGPTTLSTSFPYMSTITVTPYPSGGSSLTPTLAISTAPCDLTPAATSTSALGYVTSTSGSLKYGIGPVPPSGITQKPTAVSLTPGTTYYINVAGRNGFSAAAPYGVQNCFAGMICDVRLTPVKPPGH